MIDFNLLLDIVFLPIKLFIKSFNFCQYFLLIFKYFAVLPTFKRKYSLICILSFFWLLEKIFSTLSPSNSQVIFAGTCLHFSLF